MKLLALLVLAASAYAQPAPSTILKIKFTDTKLENGLRVIISEDHYAPAYASRDLLKKFGPVEEKAVE